MLLFLDAAQINFRALQHQHVWPVRMLAIGLPLAIAIGALVAWPLLPGWPLVAVILGGVAGMTPGSHGRQSYRADASASTVTD